MKVMGLSNWIHWVSHFVWNFGFFLIPVTLLTVMLCTSFGNAKVFRFADGSLIFVFLLVYTVSMICFCFAISTLFKKGISLF